MAMMFMSLNALKNFRIFIRIFLFLIIWATVTGCSTVKDVKDATVRASKATVSATTKIVPYMGGPDSGIIRRVALIQFKNETIFEKFPMEKYFEEMIVKFFSGSCTGVRLVLPGSNDFPEKLGTLTFSPSSDILATVEKGRGAGLNAILTGGILNLSLAQEDEGILWFRETKERLQIQFSLEIFDMETGAKIFDDRFIHEIKDMAPEEIEAFKTGRPALFPTLTKSLDQLARDIALKMCDAIMAQPWSGYVVSVDGNRVYLAFGKEIGIRSGEVLEVYETGKIFENLKGEKFILPGKKIGEIKVTQMEAKNSMAEIISGENIQTGNPVKFKK